MSASSWVSLVGNLASSPRTPVLLAGAGAGGRDVARHLHRITHPRRRAPFIDVDCTWLPAESASRLLFGVEHGRRVERGFVERADGGTLFLDDVTELPGPEQSRLAKLLDTMHFRRQTGTRDVEVSLRLVAALAGPEETALRQGRLRRDLYSRLSVFRIVLS